MNVAGFGDTAGEQDALSTQLERRGHVLTVLHAGTAQHPHVRVHGLDGLRVIDASIMPFITNGNTNAPSLMIGEKGASMILETRRGRNAA